jgi:pyrimidine deaminase RibD-like protein
MMCYIVCALIFVPERSSATGSPQQSGQPCSRCSTVSEATWVLPLVPAVEHAVPFSHPCQVVLQVIRQAGHWQICMWSAHCRLAEAEVRHLRAAANASQASAGETYPHPNHGGVLVGARGTPIASAGQRAQGAPSVEEQLLRGAASAARGGTLYLNLESGDCHGDTAALEWIVASGVSRVVVGTRHPLAHMRGAALGALKRRGVDVQLLEAHADAMSAGSEPHGALLACLHANEVRQLLAPA